VTSVTLTTRDGLHLQGERSEPPGTSRGAVLVCHPHTLNGGSMDAGLVPLVHDAVTAAGFTSLRFDFRGAGRSEGRFGRGVGELDDVAAAVAHLREAAPEGPLVLTGWSFGAAVALRYLIDTGTGDAWLGIALPLGPEEHGIPRVRAEELQQLRVPLAFVHGTEDTVAPLYRVRALAQLTERATLHPVEGAGHLLRRESEVVTDLVVRFVASVAEAGAGAEA
jgi:uncharacterized protein